MNTSNGKIIQFPTERGKIKEKLFALFLENPLAFAKYIEYCHYPNKTRLDKNSFKLLVEKELLRSDFTIPFDIRTVVLYSTICN